MDDRRFISNSPGKFITVEGTEGAGKSSNLGFIRSLLEMAGKRVLFTREPGGTTLGEDIRALLLGHRQDGMAEDTELMLMFAARAEHLASKIVPALERGEWVVCDRFTDASFAYQGGGRGIDAERIRELETWVQKGRRPDLTLLLDLPVEVGLERAGRRSDPDRFEKEARPFFERVRTAYLDIAQAEPNRVRVVDASRSLPDVQHQIAGIIDGYLAEHANG